MVEIGDRIGGYTILRDKGKGPNNFRIFEAECLFCGKIRDEEAHYFTNPSTFSCGCQYEKQRDRIIDAYQNRADDLYKLVSNLVERKQRVSGEFLELELRKIEVRYPLS
jgi:hypothetical protein